MVESILDQSLDQIIANEGLGGSRSGRSRGPRGQKRERDLQDTYAAEPIRVARRIYVSGLSPRTAWQDLKDFFGSVGTVVYANVLGERGRSKGCGIVEFEMPQQAADAINQLHLAQLDGTEIYVREDREDFELRNAAGSRKQPRRSSGGGSGSGARLFVRNLSFETTWQGLKDAFAGCAYADVLTDSGGRSKGVGVVEYADAAEAQAAIESMDGTTLDGREISVREDREPQAREPASQGAPGSRIYVNNLSWKTTWQGLKDHCASAGCVVRADVLTERGGRSKGCGIVEFEDAETAAAAIEALNESELDGRTIYVREDREAGGRL